MGYYHQNERDMAVGAGLCFIVFAFLLLICITVALYATSAVTEEYPPAHPTGGSTAGANAVTFEELEAQSVM